jgi:hypothetical protein
MSIREHSLNVSLEAPSESPNEPIDLESRLNASLSNMQHKPQISPDLEKESTHRTQHGREEAIDRIATAQDWDGPKDPENPLNWPFGKKAYHTAVVGFLAFA